MTWLFDQTMGQLTGNFTVSPDKDDLVFQYDGSNKRSSQRPEGEEAYVQLANLVVPKKHRLLDFNYRKIPKDLVIKTSLPSWDLIGLEDEIVSKGRPGKKVKGLLSVARMFGPLFGLIGMDAASLIVREPINAWYSAAKVLNFAIKAKAVLDGRASSDWLDGDTQYMYYKHENKHYAWICFKLFFEPLPEPYATILSYSEEELAKIFPETDAAPSSGSIRSSWEPSDFKYGYAPVLRSFYSSGNHEDPYINDPLLISNQCMRNSTISNLQTSDDLISEIERALIALHTAKISLGWNKPLDNKRGVAFGVQYDNFLEHLWYNFALDAADCKIGVCPHCGQVFNARGERKDRKIYCSTVCQERAKAARNYEKRKRAKNGK